MTEPAGPHLDVTADLQLEVDGSPISVRGQAGGPLNVRIDDPARIWAHLGAVPTPAGVPPVRRRRAASHAADLLADAGVRSVVSGPDGTIATIGDGVDSALGRWLFGSSRIRVGSWRALLPLLGGAVRGTAGSPRVRGTALVAAVTAAVAVTAVRESRRRR